MKTLLYSSSRVYSSQSTYLHSHSHTIYPFVWTFAAKPNPVFNMIFPMGISFTTAAVGLALVAKNCLAAEVVGSDPCPGVLQVVDSATTCCVGGVLTLSVCAGWPICTGPVCHVLVLLLP